jgi:D-proline reductase (dithiol) PrdB
MCHQAVGLIQAEMERLGIRTASITMLPEITRAVRPPRALSVPHPLGYPLGAPRDPELQRRILRALLALTDRDDVPTIAELEPRDRTTSAR